MFQFMLVKVEKGTEIFVNFLPILGKKWRKELIYLWIFYRCSGKSGEKNWDICEFPSDLREKVEKNAEIFVNFLLVLGKMWRKYLRYLWISYWCSGKRGGILTEIFVNFLPMLGKKFRKELRYFWISYRI